MQASAPARLIEGGLPTEATVTHVVLSKYADHLPLQRQAQIYTRQGVKLAERLIAHHAGFRDVLQSLPSGLTRGWTATRATAPWRTRAR